MAARFVCRASNTWLSRCAQSQRLSLGLTARGLEQIGDITFLRRLAQPERGTVLATSCTAASPANAPQCAHASTRARFRADCTHASGRTATSALNADMCGRRFSRRAIPPTRRRGACWCRVCCVSILRVAPLVALCKREARSMKTSSRALWVALAVAWRPTRMLRWRRRGSSPTVDDHAVNA